jgi:hypothetical protein
MNRTTARRVGAVLATAVLAGGGLTACFGSGSKPSANSVEHAQQQNDSGTLVNNQPVPGYNFSQIRQNLIELETAQAQGVQTTTFFFPEGSAGAAGYAPIQVCPSIGAPIASTTQLTNPQQVVQDNANSGASVTTIGQMDPNGVYSGNSTGTYVMCVGADGKPYADYWEGPVQTVFGPARWNATTHQVEPIGAPSFTFTLHKTK